MGLKEYKKKRDFKNTPEPEGKVARSDKKMIFVIQRHKASRLHYDFRIELDGVLKSWAVPKGPSMNPKDKRLAMMVEDHPYSYKDFEGIIPSGYGAGIVEIWDSGELQGIEAKDVKDSEKKLKAGLSAGNLKMVLKGKKLKGEFALVKVKGRGENGWLLIKHRDKYAVDDEYNSENETKKNSPINKWLKENKPEAITHPSQKSAAKKQGTKNPIKKKEKRTAISNKKLEDFVKPMLAKETVKAFSDKDWVFEIKWDGYRAIAEINHKAVKLYSRNGNSFSENYPKIVDALQGLNVQAILDGEIVVMDDAGRSDFQKLQHYGTDNGFPLQFRIFDLLSLNGEDTTTLPLLDRKKLLRQVLRKKNNTLVFSDHIEGKGEEAFKMAEKNNLEGIIAKKADSVYRTGSRSQDWLKIKQHKTQEAIIVGYTQGNGARSNFGALLLAIYDSGKLKYIGHTGTGFDEKTIRELSKILKPLIRKNSPLQEPIKTNGSAIWVKPELVCEIKFTEWTREGNLRHPVFMKLRDDKKASEVTLNATTPVAVPKKAAKKTTAKKVKSSEKKNGLSPADDSGSENEIKFGRVKVRTTNRQKIFWPEESITKGDVINYYNSISKYILPFLKDRPQSLLRHPNGIEAQSFFHKDAGDDAPSFVSSKTLYSESSKKDIDYILCNNAATLIYLNNLGCIEINPWHSTIKKLENPDYVIIDIDPSVNNTYDQVVEVAQVTRDVLKRAGAECYCKTSGASGMHVYIPAQKKYTYDQLKDFAHLVCLIVQEQLSAFTSLERSLKKRGDDHIYLDHLQNRKGQTISSVYSLRPKPGVPVSMPLKWEEVKKGMSPLDYNMHNALKRIEKMPGLFAPVLGKGIDLKKCLKLLDR